MHKLVPGNTHTKAHNRLTNARVEKLHLCKPEALSAWHRAILNKLK